MVPCWMGSLTLKKFHNPCSHCHATLHLVQSVQYGSACSVLSEQLDLSCVQSSHHVPRVFTLSSKGLELQPFCKTISGFWAVGSLRPYIQLGFFGQCLAPVPRSPRGEASL